MTSITLRIDDDKAARLRSKAEELGMNLEQLIAASLEDIAGMPDPDFESAIKKVMGKNSELYKRLA